MGKSYQQKKFDHLYTIVLSFYAFGISLFDRFLPYLLGLWIVTLFIRLIYFRSFQLNHFYLIVGSGLLLFMTIAGLSLLWSINLSTGMNKIETRLSLLILPLMHLFQRDITVDKRKIFLSFIFGTLFFSFINLGWFVIRIFIEDDWFLRWTISKPFYMFYTYLSPFKHTSYWALNLLIALGLIFGLYNNSSRTISEKSLYLLIFILLVLIFLSGSRSAIFISFCILSFFIMKFIFDARKKMYRLILLSFPLLLLIVILFFNERFIGMDNSPKTNVLISDSRIIQWKSSLEIIRENPFFGLGIGDVTEELTQAYQSINFSKGVEKRLNSHNQFIESILESGIPGLFSMLALFYIPLFYKRKNFKGRSIFLIFVTMMLFECILNRIAGVSIFLLIYFITFYKDVNDINADY